LPAEITAIVDSTLRPWCCPLKIITEFTLLTATLVDYGPTITCVMCSIAWELVGSLSLDVGLGQRQSLGKSQRLDTAPLRGVVP